MYHWDKLFKNGQKRGSLKRSDLFKNLIVAFSISLFKFQLKLLKSIKEHLKVFH